MFVISKNGAKWLKFIDGDEIYLFPEAAIISDTVVDDITNYAIRVFKRKEDLVYYPPNNEYITKIRNYAFVKILQANVSVDKLSNILADCSSIIQGEETK